MIGHQKVYFHSQKKGKKKSIPLFVALVILGARGYIGLTKFEREKLIYSAAFSL